MKLFRVEITKVVYMLAEDERDAELDGSGYACDEDAANVMVDEVRTLDDVDGDWKDALPYGGEEDLTVRQWFERPEEPVSFIDPPEQLRIDFSGPGEPAK